MRTARKVGIKEQEKDRLREFNIDGLGGGGDSKVPYRAEIIWLNQFTSLRYKQIKRLSFLSKGMFCFWGLSNSKSNCVLKLLLVDRTHQQGDWCWRELVVTFPFTSSLNSKEYYILGYNDLYSAENQPTFRKNKSPIISGSWLSTDNTVLYSRT
jgi:hypothetical protein